MRPTEGQLTMRQQHTHLQQLQGHRSSMSHQTKFSKRKQQHRKEGAGALRGDIVVTSQQKPQICNQNQQQILRFQQQQQCTQQQKLSDPHENLLKLCNPHQQPSQAQPQQNSKHTRQQEPHAQRQHSHFQQQHQQGQQQQLQQDRQHQGKLFRREEQMSILPPLSEVQRSRILSELSTAAATITSATTAAARVKADATATGTIAKAEATAPAATTTKEATAHAAESLSFFHERAGSILIVSQRQKNNPILKYTIAVPYAVANIAPDFLVGTSACVLFVSLRYHQIFPSYLLRRMQLLQQARYVQKFLLAHVDLSQPDSPLAQITVLAVHHGYSLVLGCSVQECAGLLQLLKTYENKPPDVLQARKDSKHSTRVMEALTAVSPVNRTDVLMLARKFRTMKNILDRKQVDFEDCTGIGTKKAKKLIKVFQDPFVQQR